MTVHGIRLDLAAQPFHQVAGEDDCGGGIQPVAAERCGGGNVVDESTGTLNLSVTDAPVDSASRVLVQFTVIAVKPKEGDAVEIPLRGAHNVDRGVEVSNEAERALKKILESSQKSTNMVRAIARATVEQAKGSKQVTDAIGRIAETVQQIAAATAQQARGSDQIMKSAEKMRMITQHVERSSQEQARGGRQITASIEQISSMVNTLNTSQRGQRKSGEQLVELARGVEDLARAQGDYLKAVRSAFGRVERGISGKEAREE